jgi:hypothetical protein
MIPVVEYGAIACEGPVFLNAEATNDTPSIELATCCCKEVVCILGAVIVVPP